MIGMRSPAKRMAALVVDALISVLARLLPTRTARTITTNPSVLLVRCDHIGDAIMATAVIAGLRSALAPSRLDVLAGPWAAPIFANHPDVDGVLEYAAPWWLKARGQPRSSRLRSWGRLPGIIRRIRRARYDIGIDLRGDLRQIACFLSLGGVGRRVSTDRTGARALLTDCWPFDPARHEVEKNSAIVGLLGVESPPELVCLVPAPDARLLARLQAIDGSRGFVAFALQGSEPKRAWPSSYASEVIAGLIKAGYGAVVIGGGKDRELGDQIASHHPRRCANLAGELTIAQSMAVLSRAASTVAVDSGPMHMAAAAGSPVVALFGPGDPAQSRPWTGQAIILGHGAPCGCRGPVCDLAEDGLGLCMRKITVAEVLSGITAAMALPPVERDVGYGAHSRPSPAP